MSTWFPVFFVSFLQSTPSVVSFSNWVIDWYLSILRSVDAKLTKALLLSVLEVVGVESCFALVVVLTWVDKVGCAFVVEDWTVLDFVDVDGDFVLLSCVVFFLTEVVWLLVDCCVFVDILALEVGDTVVALWEVVRFTEVGIVFERVEVVELLRMVGWVLVVVRVLFTVVDFFAIVVFLVDDVLGDTACLVDVALDLTDVSLTERLK